jgi:hypothetical protein
VGYWPLQPDATEAQFIFGGYSWRKKDFQLWTFQYDPRTKKFAARPAASFHAKLRKAAFIGDWATRYRAALIKQLNLTDGDAGNFEPLTLLAKTLREQQFAEKSSIGGAPQLVRVGPHMNTRIFCVKWGTPPRRHLFGRPLFDYERCDYWSIDPFSGKIESPTHFNLSKSPPSAD